MQELVIDTNALIFYVIEDSKEHAKADKALNSLSKWYVPTIVIY
ncbi:MAG: PIN domain-containing protein, partial [Caldivirga sp.]